MPPQSREKFLSSFSVALSATLLLVLEPDPTNSLEPDPTNSLEPDPTNSLEPDPTNSLEPDPTNSLVPRLLCCSALLQCFIKFLQLPVATTSTV